MGLAQTRSQTAPSEISWPAQSDIKIIRSRVRASGSSFYWAMRILPRERREALFAIYAFCREVDDIADGDLTRDQKIADLRSWRDKIDSIFEGCSMDAITRALNPAITKYNLQKKDFLAVIDGMEMDALGPIIAPSTATLDQYCDLVASAVGRLCIRAFGEPTEAGEQVADHLGRALQLTNILRDVKEDALTGRLYIPTEALDFAGIEGRSPTTVINDRRLPYALEFVGKMAEKSFSGAQHTLAACPKDTMRPAVIMMTVYRKHLERMQKNGWKPLPVTKGFARVRANIEKFWIAVLHGLF